MFRRRSAFYFTTRNIEQLKLKLKFCLQLKLELKISLSLSFSLKRVGVC